MKKLFLFVSLFLFSIDAFAGGVSNPGSGATAYDYTNAPDGVVFESPHVTGIAIGTGGGAIATHLFQVPTGKIFVCTGIFAEVTSVSGGNSGALTFYARESGGNAQMTHNGASAATTPVVGHLYSQLPTFNTAPYKPCTAGNYVDFYISAANNSTSAVATGWATGYYRRP